jgi:uncharacterized protein (DUF1015 family)
VVCPPYDVITPAAQDKYYQISEYNAVRLVLGKQLSQDNATNNRYTRAAKFFEDWLRQGLLKQDPISSIYLYGQKYIYRGEKKERKGFIALMKLPTKDHTMGREIALPHENIHPGPKEDRLRLIREAKANLSPIFSFFPDRRRIISRLFGIFLEEAELIVDILDEERTEHILWRLSKPGIIDKLKREMEDRQVFIADGHHRYEVALAFRDEMKKNSRLFKGDESYNYIMTYFSNLESQGLIVLPIHRVISNVPNLEEVLERLVQFFKTDRIDKKNQFFFLLEKAGQKEHAFGCYIRRKGFYLLRLREKRILDKSIDLKKPREYKELDVVIFQSLVIESLLNLNETNDKISYTKDSDEAINLVDGGNADVAFFLNPPRITQIRDIALCGERLPPKSTYFYPKLLTGLVFNKFNEDIS